jgi:ribonuclease III
VWPVRRARRPSSGPLTGPGPLTNYAALRAALGDPELDPELLERALTHRSYAYENGGLPTNERLEFLGDSVLGVVVTETLYRTHPDLSEGRLAKLRAAVVNARALAGVGRGIGIGDHVMLGRGEESTGGREKASILSDTVEAVIGADHMKTFTAQVRVGTGLYGNGVGRSKKEAEQAAAETAYGEIVAALTPQD